MTLLTSTQFFSFLGAAMLITVSPGPDNLMVLSIGASRGRIRGMAFGLGCAIGCLSHTLLAALGVSALINASHGDAPWQIAQLGITFTLQGALLFGMLGYFAGVIGQWLNRHERAGLWLDRVAGTIFVGLGLKLIVSR